MSPDERRRPSSQGAIEFPLRRSALAWPFVGLFAPGRHVARIDPDAIEVRVGLLGNASIPLRLVDRVSTMRWPWWAGVGVRIGRGLVAFVPASGDAAVLELAEDIPTRAPLRWRTRRIVIGVEDVEAFADALAKARRA